MQHFNSFATSFAVLNVDGPSHSSTSVSSAGVRKGIMLDPSVYHAFDLFVIVKIIVLYGIE